MDYYTKYLESKQLYLMLLGGFQEPLISFLIKYMNTVIIKVREIIDSELKEHKEKYLMNPNNIDKEKLEKLTDYLDIYNFISNKKMFSTQNYNRLIPLIKLNKKKKMFVYQITDKEKFINLMIKESVPIIFLDYYKELTDCVTLTENNKFSDLDITKYIDDIPFDDYIYNFYSKNKDNVFISHATLKKENYLFYLSKLELNQKKYSVEEFINEIHLDKINININIDDIILKVLQKYGKIEIETEKVYVEKTVYYTTRKRKAGHGSVSTVRHSRKEKQLVPKYTMIEEDKNKVIFNLIKKKLVSL